MAELIQTKQGHCLVEDMSGTMLNFFKIRLFTYSTVSHKMYAYLVGPRDENLAIINIFSIDLFAIWRKGLRRARPILTALATVGNQWNPLFAARLHLPAKSSYLRFICTFPEL